MFFCSHLFPVILLPRLFYFLRSRLILDYSKGFFWSSSCYLVTNTTPLACEVTSAKLPFSPMMPEWQHWEALLCRAAAMVVMAVTPGGPQNASLTIVCNVYKKYNIPPKETLSACRYLCMSYWSGFSHVISTFNWMYFVHYYSRILMWGNTVMDSCKYVAQNFKTNS